MSTVLKTEKKCNLPGAGPGRPKGLKNKTTLIKEAIQLDAAGYFAKRSKEEGEAILDKFIDAAKRGQPWAIQEFMERNLGRVKEFVEVSAPDTTLTVEVVKVTD